MNGHRVWDKADDDLLLKMALSGDGPELCASTLRKPVGAVIERLQYHAERRMQWNLALKTLQNLETPV